MDVSRFLASLLEGAYPARPRRVPRRRVELHVLENVMMMRELLMVEAFAAADIAVRFPSQWASWMGRNSGHGGHSEQRRTFSFPQDV